MVIADEGLSSGFADPVHDSQAVFRELLSAMSRPGLLHKISGEVDLPPDCADVALVAACLALADRDTPLWFDDAMASPELQSFLRFHCGATSTPDLDGASFVMIGDASGIPSLSQFNLGSDAYPDRAATALVRVTDLADEGPFQAVGPGVDGVTTFGAAGIRSEFWEERRTVAKLFPRGVDLILGDGRSFMALPRTTIVTEL